MEIFIATVGVVVGASGLVYSVIRRHCCAQKDKITQKENEALIAENSKLLQEKQKNYQSYEESLEQLKKSLEELNKVNQQKENVNMELNLKQAQMDALTQNLETLSSSMTATARAAFEQYCDSLDAEYVLREKELDATLAKLDLIYDERQNYYVNQESSLLTERRCKEAAMQAELSAIQQELEKTRATKAAAIEAQLREEEIKKQATFYTLQLDEADKRDIAYLQSIEYNLREPRPLRMLIWTTFYRDKVNDLAARLGAVGTCGIYKITHLETGIAYVGQSKDIKERWYQEIKEALGIDTKPTNLRAKFMREKGVDNFTFEILEKCASEELNEKEKFYIDLYQTYDFGLNANRGVSKN